MTISFSTPHEFECDGCGTVQVAEFWSVVSSIDRPDVIEMLRQGYTHQCQRCGRRARLELPVLVHRPEQGGMSALVFAAASTDIAPLDESMAMADRFVDVLFANLRLNGAGVTVRLIALPWLALPAMLSRDVRRDMTVNPALLHLPSEIAGSYRPVLAELRRLANIKG